ncbi:MAG: HEAT repeat domain-containing protein [Pseudomonadota bacterium]
MALVKPKRATSTRRKSADEATVESDLRSADAATRREAIRSAIDTGAGKGLLAEALTQETSSANLDLIFSEALRLETADTLGLLTPYLANHDAVLRNKATECLQAVGAPAVEALRGALTDPDVDVRIQAMSVVPRLGAEAALPLLSEVLAQESEENVIACAVEALVELDDPRALSELEALQDRPGLPPSLAFAVGFAMDRLADDARR